ncbi:MAG TPA: phosphoribosylanthranilate isomerase [Chloroflexota bacterium]
MRTRIKICCIASAEEARLAVECGADAIGLVGRMPSGPGPIPDERIASIAMGLSPPIASFLLTSETTSDGIADHVSRTGVSTVQIVSHLDPRESEAVARRLPTIRRVQVIHVEDRNALDLIDVYAEHVHAFLLDSGRPNAATPKFGGTGHVHDWDISRAFVEASPRPVFLAGGLTPENVERAIRHVSPFGVDLCSGIRKTGRLDRDLLTAFVLAVRTVDASRAN